jgi:L-aspartate oxidase
VISDLERRCRSPQFANALVAARMIAAAALARIESRGGHYRGDFTGHDPAWRHRTFMSLADAGRIGGDAALPVPGWSQEAV